MRNRKPCPGCKAVVQYRAADEVCHDCQQLLADGKLLRKERLAAAAEAGTVLAIVPGADHWMPYLYDGDDVMAAFRALGIAAGKPITERDYETPTKGGYASTRGPAINYNKGEPLVGEVRHDHAHFDDDRVALPKKVHTAICKLWAAVKAWGDAREAEGHKDGRNLLLGLAQGDVSVKELNKLTVKAK